MQILENSIFHSAESSSKLNRTARLQSALIVGNDFYEFGESYFDGGDDSAAYQKYIYDGRYKQAAQRAKDFFSLDLNSSILEFGCAKGYILSELRDLGFIRLKGIEISEYAVLNAHPTVKDCLHLGGVDALRRLNCKFDFIFSKEVLPHLSESDLSYFLYELRYCIHKNTSIYFEIQVAQSDEARLKINRFDPTHRILWSADKWRQVLVSLPYSTQIAVHFKELF
jgi:cyclopropane fatty-acyl-phospholipid synthase-like methyltransferase